MATIAQLVVDVVANTASIERSVSTVNSKLDSMGSVATKIGGLLAGAFTVDAVVSYGRELLTTADHIVKVADRTGLLTDEVQKLEYIAEQSGNSLDELTQAMSKLQVNLGSNNAGTIRAIKDLGINLQDLRESSPFEQMEMIASAIQAIPDPAQRAATAVEIFGRSGAAILPTLIANFRDLAEEAPVMGERTVKNLDRAGDALSRLGKLVKTAAGEGVGVLFDAWDRMFSNEEMIRAEQWANAVGLSVNGLTHDLQQLAMAFKEVATPKLPSARDFGKPDMSGMPTTDALEALRLFNEQTKTQEESARKAADALRDHERELDKMAQTAVRAYREYHDALFQVDLLFAKITQSLNKGGKLLDLTDSTDDTIAYIKAWTTGMPVIEGLGKGVKDLGEQIDTTFSPAKLTKMQQFGQGLAQTIMSALTGGGNIAKSIGGFLGNTLGGLLGSSTAVGSKLASTLGATIGGAVGSIIPGLGTILGAYGGQLIAKLFDRGKGREAVVEFANSLGGFDELHRKLLELGDAGENLWKKLGSVGSNNANQAKSVIDEITKALNGHQSQLERATDTLARYGLTWEDTGQKFKQSQIDQMAKSLLQDFDDLLFLGVDVDKIIDKMGDSVIAFVQAALRTGTEVPESMRPLIERLIEMGRLLDQNGELITDINQIPFAQTMSQGFKDVVEAINRVARALGYVFDTFDGRTITIPVEYLPGEIPVPLNDVPIPSFANGSNGLRNFGTGTLAMLHGNEAVVTQSDYNRTPVVIQNHFHDPVYAYDETHLARQADRMSEATIQSLKARGTRLRTTA